MRLTRLLRPLAGPVVLASLVGLAVALLFQSAEPWTDQGVLYGGSTPLGAQNQSPGDTKAKPGQDFTIADIAGRGTSLYPGANQARWVRISNPNNFDILVTSLTAVAGTPLDPDNQAVTGCATTNLRVEPLSQPVIVPKDGTVDVALTARLAATAPNACQNVRFPLTYNGIASKP